MAKATEKSNAALVILESPAKAKTINKYLGPGYVVKASLGHVRDLPERDIGVDVEHDFAPTYEILSSRLRVVNELKTAARQAKAVYLATDLDREGEAIAWHLTHALKLPESTVRRVIFNEITRSAIQKAFDHPGRIDLDKVNAQQARRILDRLVGYKVSPLLWKKVARGLSAGRVQSVAVKLIVDREAQIDAFIPEEYWRLQAIFTTNLAATRELARQWSAFLGEGEEVAPEDDTDSAVAATAPSAERQRAWLQENQAFRADLIEFDGRKFDPRHLADAQRAALALGLEDLQVQTTTEEPVPTARGGKRAPARSMIRLSGHPAVGAGSPEFRICGLTERESLSRPPGPFNTSTLQQAANNQLGFGAQRTMRIAQQLYEGVEIPGQGAVGLITYMRTDSLNLSRDALTMVRQHIEREFGAAYLPAEPNRFTSRAGAQEAHEAIRPTDVQLRPESIRDALSEEQYRLYQLIWKRFVACQMTPAVWRITEALIEARRTRDAALDPAKPPRFKGTGRNLKFDGFTRVAGIGWHSEEQFLPVLANGQQVAPLDLTPTQHFTSPPPRYTEASLVKALETEGIGRPSTYASIIATIQNRHYVELKQRRFHATDLGVKVTAKLVEGFPDLMALGFTRKIEGELDQIEEAQRPWVQVVRDFYDPLAQDLLTAEKRMTHARAEASPSEHKCPKCGAMMVYRLSKRGKNFLSCSRYPACDGAASVDAAGNPITLQLTEYKCPTCGKPMIKRSGRFGPFFGCSGYPECKTIQQADRVTGLPLPPKPPPKSTGLSCPKCNKNELVIRSGKRGEFLSCAAYPRCRMTLPAERLAEFLEMKSAARWPPPDIAVKAHSAASRPGKKRAEVSYSANATTAPHKR